MKVRVIAHLLMGACLFSAAAYSAAADERALEIIILYCKRGQLQRAQEHLERQSVNCLTPVITLEKMQRGRRTTVS
ncbi:hypothetical protein N8R11_26705, partial [Enterobacter hormaechei subsp. xiangfangensis]|nr:hypothetical protein [Enterobacter hormaechei subsp. xiangfangensis]